LSTGKTENIAFLVQSVANPYFPPMIRSAQLAAENLYYCVFLADFEESGLKEEKLIERFSVKVEGVILISSRMPEERLQRLARKIAIVLVNRDVPEIPRVLIDAGSSLKQAVRLLANQGHRGIAYINGPSVTWTNMQRQAAISDVTNELGMRLIVIPKPWLESGQAVVVQIMSSGLTGAIAFNDLIAHGIMTELSSRAFTVHLFQYRWM
jgi:LacI family transcriptional regulator